MAEKGYYSLPELPYGYEALEPLISKEQLTIHHDKHHAGYVKNANALIKRMEEARRSEEDLDMKAALKELTFNIGGNRLHNLFWPNLAPEGGGDPGGRIADELVKEFGSIERFKKEFSQAANSVEGSGWAALSYCPGIKRPLIVQIEKHNVNVVPSFAIIMVLDVWEHAYYIDHKNDRGSFVDSFWKLVDWDEVDRRLEAIL